MIRIQKRERLVVAGGGTVDDAVGGVELPDAIAEAIDAVRSAEKLHVQPTDTNVRLVRPLDLAHLLPAEPVQEIRVVVMKDAAKHHGAA